MEGGDEPDPTEGGGVLVQRREEGWVSERRRGRERRKETRQKTNLRKNDVHDSRLEPSRSQTADRPSSVLSVKYLDLELSIRMNDDSVVRREVVSNERLKRKKTKSAIVPSLEKNERER